MRTFATAVLAFAALASGAVGEPAMRPNQKIDRYRAIMIHPTVLPEAQPHALARPDPFHLDCMGAPDCLALEYRVNGRLLATVDAAGRPWVSPRMTRDEELYLVGVLTSLAVRK